MVARTCEIDEVRDARLLVFTGIVLDELIERDGDDSVRATARCVHVRRRNRARRRPCDVIKLSTR